MARIIFTGKNVACLLISAADPDPFHLAGSRSVSDNPDSGSATKYKMEGFMSS